MTEAEVVGRTLAKLENWDRPEHVICGVCKRAYLEESAGELLGAGYPCVPCEQKRRNRATLPPMPHWFYLDTLSQE